jgi:hypothetical protein
MAIAGRDNCGKVAGVAGGDFCTIARLIFAAAKEELLENVA